MCGEEEWEMRGLLVAPGGASSVRPSQRSAAAAAATLCVNGA